jgi:hypothetical protein
MDKRWRNLIILIILVLVVVLALNYNALFGLIPQEETEEEVILTEQEIILEEGYSDILEIFEENDVNITNVRNLETFYVDDSGEMVYNESSEKLLKLSSDLEQFSIGVDSKYPVDEALQLGEAATILNDAVLFSLKSANLAYQKKDVDFDTISCEQKQIVVDANAQAYELFYNLADLADEVDYFNSTYDENSEIIFIDLATHASILENISASFADFIESCEGVV